MTDQTWMVIAKKADGKDHVSWPAEMVCQWDDGRFQVQTILGATTIHHTRALMWPERILAQGYFWKDRWYNVLEHYHWQTGRFARYYCNICIPPVIEGSRIVWVDLDLDVIFYPDGSWVIEDEDEFEAHKIKYGYSADVIENAHAAVGELIGRYQQRQWPFQHIPTSVSPVP